ncbi:G-protein coupled receptor Mth2-like [Diorhabda carinulata]|uniref:G-protein coupled receptor Mth2-like n=1 Tax=Diorhabda carinulata TaxID=1163345 RepID=UPI0025A31032|nr:G-protein coupled receptor Mth2-like [Diorhabda carinulata]
MKQEDSVNSFINESLVKVGLRKCKTIIDLKFDFFDSIKSINKSVDDFCVDQTEYDGFVLRECRIGFDVCDKLKCIRKCCPDGQSYVNGAKCENTYEHGTNLSRFSDIVENHEENFAIIHNRTCPHIHMVNPDSKITIHKNGSFTVWSKKEVSTSDVKNMNSYCMEHLQRGSKRDYYIFQCFPEDENTLTKFDYRIWPFILSTVLLILTILVYVFIKEWKKMFGKILINYCMASLCVFIFLLIAQSKTTPTETECQFRAFSIIFFAIAQFSWANVMSFEIWITFGTTRIYLGSSQKEKELKKFIFYSLYGWGGPLLITLTILLFKKWKVLPYAIQPLIGEQKCFFDIRLGNYAKLVFMNIPLLIIQTINMVFFIKTVLYCVKVRTEINKRNDSKMTNSAKKFSKDRQRLFLIIKLSVVMGIGLIFEVITAFFDMSELGTVPKYIEIIFDLYNALQGVFIFIIFICKKKVFFALLHKYNFFGIAYTQSTSSIRTHSSITSNGLALTSVPK